MGHYFEKNILGLHEKNIILSDLRQIVRDKYLNPKNSAIKK